MRLVLPIVSLLAGCGAPALAPASSPATIGIVEAPDGTGVRATLAFVDRRTGTLSIEHADDHGRFSLPIDRSAISVTATTAEGYAYLDVVPATGPVTISLSNACERADGRLDRLDGGTFGPGENVGLARVSNNTGDLFVYDLAPDGTWRACLPAAQYRMVADVVIARGEASHAVPGPPAVVRTTTPAEARALPPAVDVPRMDQRGFEQAIPATVQVISLAESNHGTAEFTTTRGDIALDLAERGFTLIAIEASFGDVLAADDYIAGGATPLARAVEETSFFMWKTTELAATLDRFRAFNETRSPDARLLIVGFDVQRPEHAIDLLLGDARLSEENRALLARLRDDTQKAWAAAALPAREALLDALESMKIDAGAGIRANRNALASRMIRWRLQLADTDNEMSELLARERGMTDMIAAFRECDPDRKMMLWGHLGHLAREYFPGQDSLGASLARMFGSSYFVLGLLSQQGELLARPGHGKPVATQVFGPAEPYSVEVALGGRLDDDAVAYVMLSSIDGPLAQWLSGLRHIRELGALFLGSDSHWSPLDVSRGFDAFAIFGKTHASHRYLDNP